MKRVVTLKLIISVWTVKAVVPYHTDWPLACGQALTWQDCKKKRILYLRCCTGPRMHDRDAESCSTILNPGVTMQPKSQCSPCHNAAQVTMNAESRFTLRIGMHLHLASSSMLRF